MKSLTKLLLASVAIATLAGCTSAPIHPPKTEADRLEVASRLHVPVAINLTDFTWHKVTIHPKEGFGWFDHKETGTATIFTNKKTGKTYDFEGQPVNDKGHRILVDGYECAPKYMSKGAPIYGEWSTLNASDSLSVCQTFKSETRKHNKNTRPLMLLPAVVSGPASIAALTYLSTVDNDTEKKTKEIEDIIKDDYNF